MNKDIRIKSSEKINGIVKLIGLVLLALITYAHYFEVIPMKESVVRNRESIYELSIEVEKYRVQNSLVFENILDRIERLE